MIGNLHPKMVAGTAGATVGGILAAVENATVTQCGGPGKLLNAIVIGLLPALFGGVSAYRTPSPTVPPPAPPSPPAAA